MADVEKKNLQSHISLFYIFYQFHYLSVLFSLRATRKAKLLLNYIRRKKNNAVTE